jgi:hypothetical protein
MQLLNVTRHDGYLLIHTDKGIKRRKLSDENIIELEKKCKLLIGKEIYQTTWEGWDHQYWFDEIFPVKETTSKNKT